MLKKMTVPGESIAEEEESEDTDDTDGVSDPAAIADTESFDKASPVSTRKALEDVTSSSGILSPARTRSRGKAVKKTYREPSYKGYEVVYLLGDINGLTKKLHLLAADFFAGNTTVRTELIHVLDALLRLKQLTRKEYTDIIARLAASL